MVQELTGWKKKYRIRDTNSGSLDGHKTYINITWKTGMRLDFRDLRFVDKKGNLLPHYLLEYLPGSWAQFWVWLPAPTANPIIYCYFGNGAVKSASSFSGIQGIFVDYFESGAVNPSKWDLKTYGTWIQAGIRTDIRYNNYSLGLDIVRGGGLMLGQDQGHSLLKIPLTSLPVGSRALLFMLAYRSTSAAADFLGFGNGEDSLSGCLYSLPSDSTWHDYLVKIYRSDVNTWDIYIMKDGVLDASLTGISRVYDTYFLFGLQTYDLNGTVNDYARIDNIIGYLEPSAWFSGYPSGLIWSTRCLLPYRKTPYSQTITAQSTTLLTPGLAGYQDSIVSSVPGLAIGNTSYAFGTPEELNDSTGLELSEPAATLTDYNGLEDFALVSVSLRKSISDSYWNFSGSFSDDLVPGPGSPISFSAKKGAQTYKLFTGKVISNAPTLGYLGQTLQMGGADNGQSLAIQKIPWDARVLELSESFPGWDIWVDYLCNYSVNRLVPMVISRPVIGSIQITLDPKNSRLEAIKKICDYSGFIFFIKLVNIGTEETPIWKNGVYFIDPADIDLVNNGLDLAEPLILTAPSSNLLDNPVLEPDPENNFNTATVYGTLSADNQFYVMTAQTQEAAAGFEEVREYVIEDNSITEKGSSFTLEAVKWLLYFQARPSAVRLKFIDTFNLELYQRIKLADGFPSALQGLTSSSSLNSVRVFDPRDPLDFQNIDVSGVPRPQWLRITEINYSCQLNNNTVDVKAVVDFIYSNADPVLDPSIKQYIGNGYYKPEILDSTATTQNIITSTISKTPAPIKGTVLSVSGTSAQVLTSDGKTIMAVIVSEVSPGASVMVLPGSAGYYVING